MGTDSIFANLALLLGLAAVLGFLANALRQPLVIVFIAVGILAGPSVLDLFPEGDSVALLSDVGICILLFAVGLKLDFSVIKSMGKVAVSTGLGQVVFTSFIGYFLCIALGFDTRASLYIAVALTFSSTIIIVKLLSDKREIEALHGRIAIGFLIVQDLLVVLVMIGLSALDVSESTDMGFKAIQVVLNGGAFIFGVLVLGAWVLPRVLQVIAQKPELLTLFGIFWAVSAGALSHHLGLSQEVGAFIAGISLASCSFRESIGSRLVSLRDFLLLFFFVHLGSTVEFEHLSAQFWPAFLLSFFVLVGNPLIVMVIMGVMGYKKRTGFLAGLTVAQISEFSFILAALGARIGHISEETVGLITVVGLVTISFSTYLIIFSHPIYEKLAPYLSIFERRKLNNQESQDYSPGNYEYLIFGMGRMGEQVIRSLRSQGKSFLAVDFDPRVLNHRKKEKIPVIYGDIEDPELLDQLLTPSVKVVLSTIVDSQANQILVKSLKHFQFKGKTGITVAYPEQIAVFKALGVDEVFCPLVDMGIYAAEKMI